ncbi:MAG TPA: ABC transporter permease [Anaeromyxobacteraceae bacterium]|nr:ABC transporter permease [Anaeromyxobacteraceae bacterium]
MPENPSRSTGARSYVVGGVLVGQALRALAQRKGRTALTAFSIAIGIAAVVWVVAIGKAGQRRAEAQLAALGEGLVWISAGSRNISGARTGSHAAVTLTAEDAEAILAEVPRIQSVAVQSDTSVTVVSPNGNWTTRARGISVSFLDTWWWTIAEGAAFTDRDVDEAEPVVLLGRTVRERLFGDGEAVGQDVRIGRFGYHVVGVLGVKGQSPWGRDQDDVVFLPYTSAQRRIRGKGFPSVDGIMCRAVSPAAVEPATARITDLLRERHHIAPGDDDDFDIRPLEEAANADLEVGRTFATLLISVACVSLVVGGIGIMNMMLASVLERTREIGLRMALGATKRAVQAQFLVESVMLCLCGGIAGVAASAAGPLAMERILGWDVAIPVDAVLLALGFSVAVGVFFGFYPAWKAARLDPISALRQD